ncbi:geranylgeranylglyceryl/heptaprenylglyceryl phosphate synthase [Nonlabens spongiae]|uniref:Geranylgeranylglyceryl phosphate synthase n=1 Tax=Nonlabens spongiae TaxID=331648 RepID=A0A1W6MLF4_9FLAO|nr:geranylgeranylglyceryl/heptaprenylglyceryl phosphate synthase [Nonlabens spongiae]ARN78444.1 geranylgeranylglyceryl/heptaprenylglyceryl phosphate synthase [Nonlabens spongiae]
MHKIYDLITSVERTLGILVDPEKMGFEEVSAFAKALSLNSSRIIKKFDVDQIVLLVGGSTMENVDFDKWTQHLRGSTKLPIILFPGSHKQVSSAADAILYLNLISGRNPDYLIGEQVAAAYKVQEARIEVIPTAYLLLDGKNESAVARVSNTTPMSQQDIDEVVKTALAGQFMGNKLIYLEAGSGAKQPVTDEIVKAVQQRVNTPTIVGGGLRTKQAIKSKFDAGARMVVVGTAIEENLSWLDI